MSIIRIQFTQNKCIATFNYKDCYAQYKYLNYDKDIINNDYIVFMLIMQFIDVKLDTTFFNDFDELYQTDDIAFYYEKMLIPIQFHKTNFIINMKVINYDIDVYVNLDTYLRENFPNIYKN